MMCKVTVSQFQQDTIKVRMLDRNWREFGRHEEYVRVSSSSRSRKNEKFVSESSGERRPLMRGWCHFVQTILLLWLIFRKSSDLISLVFLGGKLCCVGASAHLHMIGFRTEKSYQIANAIDWSMIVISGAGNIACLALTRYSNFVMLRNLFILGPILLSLTVGYSIYMGELSRSNDLKSSRVHFMRAKSVILIGFAIATYIEIQTLGEISSLYILRIVLILAGFVSWQTKQPGRKTFFWHNPAVWGGHEDFHFMIFVADLALCVVYFRAGIFDTEHEIGKLVAYFVSYT